MKNRTAFIVIIFVVIAILLGGMGYNLYFTYQRRAPERITTEYVQTLAGDDEKITEVLHWYENEDSLVCFARGSSGKLVSIFYDKYWWGWNSYEAKSTLTFTASELDNNPGTYRRFSRGKDNSQIVYAVFEEPRINSLYICGESIPVYSFKADFGAGERLYGVWCTDVAYGSDISAGTDVQESIITELSLGDDGMNIGYIEYLLGFELPGGTELEFAMQERTEGDYYQYVELEGKIMAKLTLPLGSAEELYELLEEKAIRGDVSSSSEKIFAGTPHEHPNFSYNEMDRSYYTTRYIGEVCPEAHDQFMAFFDIKETPEQSEIYLTVHETRCR